MSYYYHLWSPICHCCHPQHRNMYNNVQCTKKCTCSTGHTSSIYRPNQNNYILSEDYVAYIYDTFNEMRGFYMWHFNHIEFGFNEILYLVHANHFWQKQIKIVNINSIMTFIFIFFSKCHRWRQEQVAASPQLLRGRIVGAVWCRLLKRQVDNQYDHGD